MEKTHASRFIPINLGVTRAYLLQGERPILIDTGYPGDEAKITDGLARHGVEPTHLAFILISHGHPDHAGSAAELQRLSGVTLAVGLRDAPLVQMTADPHYHPSGTLGKLLLRLPLSRPPEGMLPAQPGWLINGVVDLNPYGIAGRIIPTPGHTAGSLSVALEDGQIFVGDMLMSFLTRRPGMPIYLEDLEAWKESLIAVMAMRPRILLTSHGGPYTAEAVLRRFPWAAPPPTQGSSPGR